MAIHDGITHTQVPVPQERFTAGMDKRLELLIHVLIHIRRNPFIQHEVHAMAAYDKPKQKKRPIVPSSIFQRMHGLPSASSHHNRMLYGTHPAMLFHACQEYIPCCYWGCEVVGKHRLSKRLWAIRRTLGEDGLSTSRVTSTAQLARMGQSSPPLS
jgi:hypothetical protein